MASRLDFGLSHLPDDTSPWSLGSSANSLTAFLVSHRKINRRDCSRPVFLGPVAMMNRPAAVERGQCCNSVASCEHPVTVARYELKLAPVVVDLDSELHVQSSAGRT
jgi:cellobiose phosphorylase